MVFDVGGVPDAGRVDGVLAGAESGGFDGAVSLFLQEGDAASGAEDNFAAVGVHFPGGPGFGEAVHADEATFGAILAVAIAVGGVPSHIACEFRFDFCGCVSP